MVVQEDDTYVIQGPKPLAPLTEETVGKQLQNSLLRMSRGSIAMVDAFTDQKLLYSELLQKSVDLALALLHYGYAGQNNVLTISSENSLNFFIPILASFFNGSIMAPLNHSYTLYELEHTYNISRPRVVFCAEEIAQKFVDLKKKTDCIERIVIINHTTLRRTYEGLVETLDDFINGALNGQHSDVRTFKPIVADAAKTAALIMCSSGTTGLPKGVTLSHQCINVRLAHNRNPEYHSPEQGIYTMGLLPFFHMIGLSVTLGAFVSGQTVVCHKKFDEDVFLHSIEKYKISTLLLVPPLVVFLSKTDKIHKYDLSSVKDIAVGAAPLSKETEEKVKKRLKLDSLRQGYGLTEATLAVVLVTKGKSVPGSCGKVMTYISGKVRDPETGRSLGPGKVGELCWKGPAVMMGYYKNKQATEETFTSDGWLRTGDLGYYDADGNFYVIDRLKELIKFKGFQVAPAELEAILINHPKIKDVGVVGLPDELVGERPLAFVVKRENCDITEEEVKKYVADLVSPQKRLSGGVIFIDSIPKNPTGKILRRELREMVKKYDKRLIDSKL